MLIIRRCTKVVDGLICGCGFDGSFVDPVLQMELSRIRPYVHKHCRFKLRNGREVYGVIWEVETGTSPASDDGDQHLFFASVRDYENLQRDPAQPVSVIDMPPEEILHVESLAS